SRPVVGPVCTSLLSRYLGYLVQPLKKPQRKAVETIVPSLFSTSPKRMFLSGIRSAGFPKAKDPDRPKSGVERDKLEHTSENYLSEALGNPNLDCLKLVQRYWRLIAPLLDCRGLVISVDGTDYVHPHARPNRPRGMQGASLVRDGSKESKGDEK